MVRSALGLSRPISFSHRLPLQSLDPLRQPSLCLCLTTLPSVQHIRGSIPPLVPARNEHDAVLRASSAGVGCGGGGGGGEGEDTQLHSSAAATGDLRRGARPWDSRVARCVLPAAIWLPLESLGRAGRPALLATLALLLQSSASAGLVLCIFQITPRALHHIGANIPS
jgi:hypothetical protein